MNFMFILVVIALGLLASLVAGVRYARQNPGRDVKKEIRELAASRGWDFREPKGGDVTYSVNGGAWELSELFFRSANRATTSSNYQTRWEAEYRGTDSVIIGPKLPAALEKGTIGSPKLYQILRPIFGDRISRFEGTSIIRELGSSSFRSQFDVFAHDRSAAEKLIGDGSLWLDLEAVLASPPVVTIADGSVSIVVRDKIHSSLQAEAIIRAGEAMLRLL